MFEILPVNDEGEGILAFKASGKLTDADYQQFLPTLESLIRKSGILSLYIELEDFQGWEAKAAWDDFRFGMQHDRDFKRIAIVGDRDWEPAAITLANLFTHTDMRFFRRDEAKAAWDWLEERPQKKQAPEPVQPYRYVLLATDFSPFSEQAAQRAIEMAAQYGAQLDVLNIVEERVFYNEWDDSLIADMPLRDESLKDYALDSMHKFVERTGLGKDARLEVQWGNPKRSIVSWAREKQVDLIVTGSHGHHGIERLLGSVSTSVLHHAPCDVLIVRS
ncbi:MAG: hypothetical protein DRQ45_06595 [Gammaproteobacteria bacterium]|nr:MAG: hypothetical protein DRQ45_06595 [Gammaproteobacteria bacterium]